MKIEKLTLPHGEDITLTAYLLDSSNEMPNMKVRPAMLVLPGGAYKFCSDREAEPIAMAFLEQGYNAFVLRYSIKEDAEFPRPLEDAQTALEIIRGKSEEWCVDPEKVAVIGFSAGGHLAAALSTMGSVRPNACVLGYPCILSSISNILACPVPSVEQYVTAETPPTFIFSSRTDRTVPIKHSIDYAAALDAAGVPFEMHIFGRGGHGFSLANQVVCSNEDSRRANSAAKDWLPMCVRWLNELFGV